MKDNITDLMKMISHEADNVGKIKNLEIALKSAYYTIKSLEGQVRNRQMVNDRLTVENRDLSNYMRIDSVKERENVIRTSLKTLQDDMTRNISERFDCIISDYMKVRG